MVGEPTEGALDAVWRKSGLKESENIKLDSIPFDSEYKYMAVLFDGEKENTIYIKGAPEKLVDVAFAKKNPEKIEYWTQQIGSLAKLGMRTIAGAYKKVEKTKQSISHEDLLEDIIFLGLAGIVAPPREEAVSAIAQCHKAGIQVKMITGDHVETAKSIAAKLGICSKGVAMEGKDIDALNDTKLELAAFGCHIFARTSPEHKLRIVRALQSKGVVCAMTGDGVNDAPALRMADIGIAMGIKGTEVTKEASDIVLADDNFQTIIGAVEEGRKVYDNLRKTLLFILSTNLAEGMLIMISILMGTMLILTPVQVLWINMATAVTLSMVFAFEPIEDNAMKKPPRGPGEALLTPYFIFRIIYIGALTTAACLIQANMLMKTSSVQPDVLRTIILQTVVACECVCMLNTRSILRPAFSKKFFSNKATFIILSTLILSQLAVTYTGFMNRILGTATITFEQWPPPFVTAGLLFVIVELEKALSRKLLRKRALVNAKQDYES